MVIVLVKHVYVLMVGVVTTVIQNFVINVVMSMDNVRMVHAYV